MYAYMYVYIYIHALSLEGLSPLVAGLPKCQRKSCDLHGGGVSNRAEHTPWKTSHTRAGTTD